MNEQPTEPVDYSLDGDLDVIEIWPSIQGEGPFTGTPSCFIRLAGCNLKCPACDTDYTSGRHRLGVKEIVNAVWSSTTLKYGYPLPLVVITGGEPFRQDITKLCQGLLGEGFTVQIETNGTLPPSQIFREFYEATLNRTTTQRLVIVCCPKGKVHPKLAPMIDTYKYVIEEGRVDPTDGLPSTGLLGTLAVGRSSRPPEWMARDKVFLMPLDTGDRIQVHRNLEIAATIAMTFGYRVGIQLHKVIGCK